MACDEILAITLELQCLAVVLTDQVAQPRFGKPNSGTQVRI